MVTILSSLYQVSPLITFPFPRYTRQVYWKHIHLFVIPGKSNGIRYILSSLYKVSPLESVHVILTIIVLLLIYRSHLPFYHSTRGIHFDCISTGDICLNEDTGVNITHPYSRYKFIICFGGFFLPLSCPPNHYFHATLLECVDDTFASKSLNCGVDRVERFLNDVCHRIEGCRNAFATMSEKFKLAQGRFSCSLGKVIIYRLEGLIDSLKSGKSQRKAKNKPSYIKALKMFCKDMYYSMNTGIPQINANRQTEFFLAKTRN